MSTYGDTIEKVLRYLSPRPDIQINLLIPSNPGDVDLYVDPNSPSLPSIRPGSVLSVGLEMFYVEAINTSTQVFVLLNDAITFPITIDSTNDQLTDSNATYTIVHGTYADIETLVTQLNQSSLPFGVDHVGDQLRFDNGGTSDQIIVGGGDDASAVLGVNPQNVGFAGVQDVTVDPGFAGSTPAGHDAGDAVVINPRFSRYDISVAINDEILSLSAPSVGLGQIRTILPSFIPAFAGYDLGSEFDAQTSEVLEVSFKIAPPVRTYPLIRRGDYRVTRNQTTADFPSGCGIILYKDAQPGFPVTVQFLAPFSPLVNLTDDLLAVGGVPVPAQDIVVMGAELRLATDREIQRNSVGVQPDPRKAGEVPAGAMRGATASLEQRRQRRINEEVSRLRAAFKQAEWH